MTQHPDIHRNDWTVKIMEDWTPRRLVLKIGVRAFFLDIQDDTKEPGRMEWYLAQLTNAIKSIAEPHQGPPPLEVREAMSEEPSPIVIKPGVLCSICGLGRHVACHRQILSGPRMGEPLDHPFTIGGGHGLG